MTTTRHTVDLPVATYDQVKARAAGYGLTMTDVSRAMYALFLADDRLATRVLKQAQELRVERVREHARKSSVRRAER